MAEKKKVQKAQKATDGFYKGYDIRWLKQNEDHPDYQLVAEYEAQNGEVK